MFANKTLFTKSRYQVEFSLQAILCRPWFYSMFPEPITKQYVQAMAVWGHQAVVHDTLSIQNILTDITHRHLVHLSSKHQSNSSDHTGCRKVSHFSHITKTILLLELLYMKTDIIRFQLNDESCAILRYLIQLFIQLVMTKSN